MDEAVTMELLFAIAKILVAPVLVLSLVPVMIWMERKGSAYIQDRRGPNRAAIFGIRLGGLIHNIADVIKLLTKEDIVPEKAYRFFYILAPAILMFVSFVTVAVIPFADAIPLENGFLSFQVADLNVGLLYILAMSSLSVYGIMLAGWSSNSKYSFLGGVRASSQMISYEITMGLALVSVIMMSQSVHINDIVLAQSALPWHWNIVQQPLAFLLFMAASYAETNRTPFDLPEGESELVAGFHVEYSSMKFALFFMGEYAAMIVVSALTAALFVGGWQVPFLSTEQLRENANWIFYGELIGLTIFCLLLGTGLLLRFKKGRHFKYGDRRDSETLLFGAPLLALGIFMAALLFVRDPWGLPPWELPQWGVYAVTALTQFLTFMAKTLFFCFLFVWVRWTLPRFRYDQLMKFGWKMALPLALINILITGLLLL